MKRVEINLTRCYVEWYDLDYGQRCYVCRSRTYPHVIGLVIGQAHYNQKHFTFFDVQLSYVMDWARRQGVRSLINKQILRDFKAVATPGATKDGAAFMAKVGYRKDDLLGFLLKQKK